MEKAYVEALPFFSIIMPVYNGEKYLSQAIESVINQEYESWELIVVDDESADSSRPIIEEFSKADPRVKLISQTNQGEFGSRLNGLHSARGEYITGLDQDDCFDRRYLSIVHSALEKSTYDCVVTSYKSFGDSSSFFSLSDRDETLSGKELLALILKNNCPSFWGKIVKAELYKSIDYSDIPKGIKSSAEDYLMTIPVICDCESAYICKEAILYYRDYENSYSHRYTPKVIEDLYTISQYGIDVMERKGVLTSQLLQYEYSTLINSVSHRILRIVHSKGYDVKDFDRIYTHPNYARSKKYEQKSYVDLLQLVVMRLFRKRRFCILRLISKICLHECT